MDTDNDTDRLNTHMKPWFIKEADIIKFPKPKAKVVQMPNVQSYPDFLSGVKDLHMRRDTGEISQASHDKLYTDLIHRFAKKESFETPWFLREYDSLDQEKNNIISKISGMDATNEKDAEILDRIYKLLNSETIQPNIANAFRGAIEDDNFANVDAVVKELTGIIFNIESDFKKISGFLQKLETQKSVVNVDKLTSVGVHSLADVFDGDDVAIKAFYALKRFGVGLKQKGPGEYALAVLSNKIKILQGGGDISINDKLVEVKASIGTSGGRLGMGGPTNAKAKKYWSSVSPSIATHFESGAKGLGIGQAINYLNTDYPLNDSNARNKRMEIVSNWYNKVFDTNGNAISNAFMQQDIASVQAEYIKANYEWYKSKDDFQGILILSYGAGKSAYAESSDDLVNLFRSGQLASPAISVVPSNAAPREVFTQLSLTKAKV